MRKRWMTPIALFAAASVAVLTPMAMAAGGGQGNLKAAALACSTSSVTNPHTQVVIRSTSDPKTYTSTAWTNLECGATTTSVPRGRTAVIAVVVNGEVMCTGTAGQWCLGRVLIGGIEGQPAAAEPSSLAWSTANPSGTSWESNSFNRSRVVTCPRSSALPRCPVSIRAQVRNHAAGYANWVDDLSVNVTATNN